jgi:hypothetical protein
MFRIAPVQAPAIVAADPTSAPKLTVELSPWLSVPVMLAV